VNIEEKRGGITVGWNSAAKEVMQYRVILTIKQ
jgi:hypothetical protein